MMYHYLIYPLELIYKSLYLFISNYVGSYGLSLVCLSIVTSIIIRPLINWAINLQMDEKRIQDVMQPQMEIIGNRYSGAERHAAIKRLYYRYSYHPILALRSAVGVFLQLPFLMAAYYMLVALPDIKGKGFGIVFTDLSKPDTILGNIHFMPIFMTIINLANTWTNKKFGKKDKIQATVIAGLFLVLLYNAPSALLIYWTCNNLWGLLGNIANKSTTLQIIKNGILFYLTHDVNKLTSAINKLTRNRKDLIIIFVSGVVSFIIPILRLLAFNGEYFAKLNYNYLLFFLLCLSIVSFLIAIILNKINSTIFSDILSFWLLVSFLVTFILPINLKTIDGADKFFQIRTEAFSIFTVMLAVSFLYIIFYYFGKKQIINKISIFNKYARSFIFIITSVFACYTAITFISIKQLKNIGNTYMPIVSKTQKNVFVICFDQVQGSAIKGFLIDHPEKQEALNGFVFFDDAASTYPNTNYSISSIFLGRMAEEKYEDMQWAMDSDKSFLAQGNKIGMNVSTNQFTKQNYKLIKGVGETTKLENVANLLELIRHSVNLLAGVDIFKINDLLHIEAIEDTEVYAEHGWHMNLDKFRDFYRDLSVDSGELEKSNLFYFYVGASHQPFIYNAYGKNMTKKEILESQNIDGAKSQVSYVLDEISAFSKQLKKLGVFDNSLIFVTADHGYEENINVNDNSQFKYIPKTAWYIGKDNIKPVGSYNPMLFFKDFNSKQNFIINSQPISLIDIYPTIFDNDNVIANHNYIFGTSVRKIMNENLSRERYFWEYFGGREIINKGNVEVYHNGFGTWWIKKSFLGKIYPSLAYSMGFEDYHLMLGEPIYFNAQNVNIKQFLAKGWSFPEKDFIWTIGSDAELYFDNGINAENDIVLKVTAIPYLGDKALTEQLVRVYANNIQVGNWHINKEDAYKAIIPRDLIVDGTLNLRFNINNPRSLKELNISSDTRKLGIAVKNIVLDAK